MHAVTYGLGIDVGDQTVLAAVCRDGGSTAELLDLAGDAPVASAAVQLAGGRLSVFPPAGLDADDGLVEHLLQRVGAPTPLTGSGGSLPAAEAVAAIARRAHELAAGREGGPASWTVLTVPPSWSGHRRELLVRALAAAGLRRSSVVSSAVAVVRAQLAAGALAAGATVGVYDLGASGLDTAVVRTTEDGRVEHLAAPPAPLGWGGRDLDDAVLGHVLESVPDAAAPADRREAAAVRQACRAAKEALSTETDVRVDLVLGGTTHTVRVVREDVEDLVADAVEASVDVLRATVQAAGTAVDELAAVVLAGGSARVPLVAETLSAELGRPLVADPEPARSAASGAAQLAVDRLQLEALRAELLRARPTGPGVEGEGEAVAVAAEPVEEHADEPGAHEAEDTAVVPVACSSGGRRTLTRRPRRPDTAAGGRVRFTRRHLQRAAVLTTAVLGLWAGSASLIAVLDPAGVDSSLGETVADADEPTARGVPAADTVGGPLPDGGTGGTTPVELTPAAAERFRADEPAQGDGGRPATQATAGSTSGATERVAAPNAPGTTAGPGTTAPSTPESEASSSPADTPVGTTPPVTEPPTESAPGTGTVTPAEPGTTTPTTPGPGTATPTNPGTPTPTTPGTGTDPGTGTGTGTGTGPNTDTGGSPPGPVPPASDTAPADSGETVDQSPSGQEA